MKFRFIFLLIIGFQVSLMAQKPGKLFENNLFSAMEAKDQATIDEELDKAKTGFDKYC
jgi:hypothetical protein